MAETLDEARRQAHRAWSDMAPGWESERDFFIEVGGPITAWMIDKLDPQPGQIILELAAGAGDTGFFAADKITPGGTLISSDFVPEMVAAARRGAEALGIDNAEFRVIDAEDIDLPTDSVDGVLCRWGYMLMLDPAAAMRETRRILRPGGRLVFSVMAAPPKNPWASLVMRTMVDLGFIQPPDPGMPGGLFSLSDRERLRDLVLEAGFGEPVVEEIDFHFPLANFDGYWRLLTQLAGALSQLIMRLDVSQREKVYEQLKGRVEQFRKAKGYDFPGMTLNVATS